MAAIGGEDDLRILGVDPGSLSLGAAVIQKKGQDLIPLHFRVIKARNRRLEERIFKLVSEIQEIIDQYSPQELAMEQAFFFKNPKTALVLGHVRGAVMITAMQAGLDFFEYTPADIKHTITGYGRADKQQMQSMVRALLGLDELPPPDAADALAVAICRAWHVNSDRILQYV